MKLLIPHSQTSNTLQGMWLIIVCWNKVNPHYSDVITGMMASQITSLTIVLLKRLFGRRSKKTSKLRVPGLCARKSSATGEFLAQMASNVESVSIGWCHHVLVKWVPGSRFNIKMSSYLYRKSHCGDKTVVRSSYLHNGNSYTGKMASLYWFSPLVIKEVWNSKFNAVWPILLWKLIKI